MKVKLVITGRSYDAAAGVPEQLTLDDGATLDDALKAVRAALPEDRPLPASCLVAVSGTHLGTLASHPSRQLADGDELVLIAPVAGG
jgi:molybdopterin converting factor small subunit